MEINSISQTIVVSKKETEDFLSKKITNDLTDDSLRKIGIEGCLNITVINIEEKMIFKTKGKNKDQVLSGYEYTITAEILHKNYNSNLVLDEASLPKDEVERIKKLII